MKPSFFEMFGETKLFEMFGETKLKLVKAAEICGKRLKSR